MKCRILALVTILVVEGSFACTSYADESGAGPSLDMQKKKDAVAAEIRRRKAMPHGAVFEPTDKSGEGPFTFICMNAPLIEMVQVYADYSQREVMVSASVSRAQLTCSIEGLSRTEAVASFEASLKLVKVRIVELAPKIVALVPDS